MERAFHLAIGAFEAAAAFGVVFAIDFLDGTVGGFLATRAFHDVGVFEAHFLAGHHAEEFLGRVFHKVLALNPQLAAEGDGVRAVGFVFGVVHGFHFLRLSFGIVGHDEFHGVEHGRHAERAGVEVLAGGGFEHGVVVERVELRVANHVHKLAHGLGRVAAAAQAADRRHAGVVPAVYQAFLDQSEQFALAHHRVGKVQAVELVLARAVVFEVVAFFKLVDKVIVERAVGHKLEGADRVGHAFEVVALSMCEVVHGIGFPLRARAVVFLIDDAVDDGVAEVHVGVRHVDLGAEHHRAFGQFAAVHLLKQGEAFLDGAVAEGAFGAGLRGRAFLLRDFLASLLIYVSLALFDEPHGEVPELLEIVGGIIYIAPLEAEPFDVFLNGVDVFGVFLLGVGVVEAQVAHAAKLLRHAEVHANGLGMTNVEIAVRLGRETCLETAVILTVGQVARNDLLYKVQVRLFFWCNVFCHKLLSVCFL